MRDRIQGALRAAARAGARTRARALRSGDDGSASAFVVGMVLVLFAVAGLVADGGRAVNARVAIMDDAEQAARAGADQVDAASLRNSGIARIDATRARTAAADFLAAQGYEPSRTSVSANADEVSVTVTDDVPTALLQLVFISSFTIEGTATARAALGIDTEIAGAP